MSPGRLDILCNKEHKDVIDKYIQSSGLVTVYGDRASFYRYNVLQEVFEEVICTQLTLVVY